MSDVPVAVVRGQQSDDWLKLSFDRKVAPRGTYQNSRDRWIPTIPNAFGLPAGTSCPGKTHFCRGCYAKSSEQAKHVGALVYHNLKLLQAAGSAGDMAVLLDEMIGRYLATAKKAGLAPNEHLFRIHWDGDFFSEDYARAWATVVKRHRAITYWAYTRSFVPECNVVPILKGLPNLELYLSIDKFNVDVARPLLAERPYLRLAGCATDYVRARQLIEQLGRSSTLACPENDDDNDLGLMNRDRDDYFNGKGACVTCGVCPAGRRDILFATHHCESSNAYKYRRPQEEAWV